ncbi:MAG: 16S rRNA (cytosine(1402)-N(4))-methyltransferase RsmH [Desulfobacteraceae bacterium]|nr:MAG: 16S rRNA (cytosine(1402)-N(4))-methyltransferase RsmH [Desulfobacteraceae bacterium]
MPYLHTPVMVNEVIQGLQCRPGKVYVDGTLGGAGHSRAILEKIQPGGVLIGCDQDADAVAHARQALKPFEPEVHLFHGNFIGIPDYLTKLGLHAVDGILLDLGLSLHHLKESGRGFSFLQEEPLDMRMDIEGSVTAEQIIRGETEEALEKIFRTYGEERRARSIARKIVWERKKEEIRTSKRLAEIVSDAVPRTKRKGKRIHPATQVFMALRIAVNRELERLELFMERVPDLLNPDGRLCVLSYHSLEDRIVKQRIRRMEKGCRCPSDFPRCVCDSKAVLRNLTRKVIRPTEQEVRNNPMARSARLRVAERLKAEIVQE